MEYSPKKMNENLNKNNFNLKKKFGQNFIVDENLINNIIEKSNILPNSLVIEIGPGAGSLTTKLCEVAKQVLCYEIDNSLQTVLEENLKKFNNVDVKYEDFLNSDVKKDIENYNYDNLYVIANLPYYITTPILMKLISDELNLDKIVIMVQKEVGDRFKANPGCKEYGSLSVYLNYYFNIKKLLDVSRNVFIPKPNVDSIVIEFTRKEKINIKNKDLFFQLVKDSFKQKRKTLKNNLKNYDLDKIEKVLKQYNYDLSIRAENLSVEIFALIADNL